MAPPCRRRKQAAAEGTMGESVYLNLQPGSGELAHHYGSQVHLLSDPLALTWLARLSNPACVQPEVNRLVTLLYRGLVRALINREFPRKVVKSETRMSKFTDLGYYQGQIIDPDLDVTTVDIARAGILPSMVCFEALCEVLDPARVRQDHILMNRTTNDQQQVTGAGMYGKKIAGPVKDRIVLFPDPMGATGGSLTEAIHFYLRELDGAPRKVVSLNLIVTPEFVARLTEAFGDMVSIYAIRLDRGLSPEAVLQSVPGEKWSQECGLTDHQYIVPGAGGMGEIMNNALT